MLVFIPGRINMLINTPKYILFAQHGWADTDRAIAMLAQSIATPEMAIVVPNLGYVKTWLRIEPLIQRIEQIAIETMAKYPDTPLKIVGHSMGGLMWLEVLNRHPEWWSLVDSLVMIASPVGGSHLGRTIDPLGLGLGIARDLGINRRAIAEKIAAAIPTLIIAGDLDEGSDGTVTLECTKFLNANFVCLPKLRHAIMKNHPMVAATIRDFWAEPAKPMLCNAEPDLSLKLVQRLQGVMGMTDAHRRNFARSQPYITFQDGITIRIWKNSLRVTHVFVGKNDGECLYSGFVGWMHEKHLRQTLEEIKQEYSACLYLG